MRRFEYDGPADVTPIGRGVFLTEQDEHPDVNISELTDANAWGGRVVSRLRIIIEVLDLGEEEPPKQTS